MELDADRPPSSLPAWLQALVLATLALTLAATLMYHHDLIAFPFPLDSAEPAESFMAQAVAHGDDYRSLESLPRHSEGYGPVYMGITGTLCRWGIACELPGQRALCALFIAGILGLSALICRRLRLPLLETLCALLWIYELLLVNVTPISRPGALGCLLWLAGLALPFLLDYSAASLVGAAFLLALATFTKLYFLSGAGYLGAWLLWKRRDRLTLFVLCQSAFLIAMGALTLLWLPYYFYGSMLATLNGGPFHVRYMLWQLESLVLVHSPGLALAAVLTPRLARRGAARDGMEWALYGAFGLVLFMGVLGGASGGRFTYFIQLAALPFVPLAAAVFHRVLRPRLLGLGLLIACSAWAARCTVQADLSKAGEPYGVWVVDDALIRKARHPFVDADMDCTLAAMGQPLFSPGMCAWFKGATVAKGLAAVLFPSADKMAQRYQAWIQEGRDRVADPSTDLVMVSTDSPLYFPDLLEASYLKVGDTSAPYPQTGGTTVLGVYIRPSLAASFGIAPNSKKPKALKNP